MAVHPPVRRSGRSRAAVREVAAGPRVACARIVGAFDYRRVGDG